MKLWIKVNNQKIQIALMQFCSFINDHTLAVYDKRINNQLQFFYVQNCVYSLEVQNSILVSNTLS
jgi:hypothetical protein